MHNAILLGIANKTINATTYASQLNLGKMLSGGAATYEALIHTAAIGSWSPNTQTQSNINLTGTQLFSDVNDFNDVDTRKVRRNMNFTPRNKTYQNKWEVWRDEARGFVIPNKEELFQGFKDRQLAKGNIPREHLTAGSNSFCSPSSSLADAINYLQPLISSGCAQETFLSNSASLFTAWKVAGTGLAALASKDFDASTQSDHTRLCGTGMHVMTVMQGSCDTFNLLSHIPRGGTGAKQRASSQEHGDRMREADSERGEEIIRSPED
ncbi:hypothetical protein FH972_024188 [Carpinus fangiana]|uniref:Uncharacterized protein n=1 Tax=Carpinus fangiana TaxID=176857 RepID=A0A5N6KXL6_9ROSI|nr:hypothetical protein FH972_024188 [Carpinus fangiana]